VYRPNAQKKKVKSAHSSKRPRRKGVFAKRERVTPDEDLGSETAGTHFKPQKTVGGCEHAVRKARQSCPRPHGKAGGGKKRPLGGTKKRGYEQKIQKNPHQQIGGVPKTRETKPSTDKQSRKGRRQKKRGTESFGTMTGEKKL